MAADIVGAVAAPLAKTAISFFQTPKGEQHLDPIATLFTLAMRDLAEYENAMPAVQNNYLYFDKASWHQKIDRTFTWSKVSNGDLSYLLNPLQSFTKGWKKAECDKLAPIAAHAINALAKIGAMYKAKYPNIPPLMQYYSEILTSWINDTAAPALPPEAKVIKIDPPLTIRIKEIWPKELIESFFTLYNKNDCSTLESMMVRTRAQYQELLKNPGANQ